MSEGWRRRSTSAIWPSSLLSKATDSRLLPGSSSWLLHFVVDPLSFELSTLEFAGPFVLRRVYERAKTARAVRSSDRTTSTTCQAWVVLAVFEKCMSHDVLQTGGDCHVRQLAKQRGGKKLSGKKRKRSSASTQLLFAPSPLPALWGWTLRTTSKSSPPISTA